MLPFPSPIPPGPSKLDLILLDAKPLLPIPALLILLPALWLFFRGTWKELDQSATQWRSRLAAEGRSDYRPFVALALCAVIMTLQEYYGGRAYYDDAVRPWLIRMGVKHPHVVRVIKYDDLFSLAWWAATRVG